MKRFSRWLAIALLSFSTLVWATFLPGQSNGALNGVTYVDVVAAPGSSTYRMVKSVNFYNADTAAVEITLALDDNGTVRLMAKQTVQAGQWWVYDSVIVLNTTTKKLKAKLTGAPASTNPDWVTSYGDKS